MSETLLRSSLQPKPTETSPRGHNTGDPAHTRHTLNRRLRQSNVMEQEKKKKESRMEIKSLEEVLGKQWAEVLSSCGGEREEA